jgi:hypothetical protein
MNLLAIRAGTVLRFAMLLLVATISTGRAQDENRTVIVLATGGLSCGKWTNTPRRSFEHDVFRKWVLGFVSGVNFENTDGDFLKNMDADALTAWVDNYCRRNPLHGIVQAMLALIQELRSRR